MKKHKLALDMLRVMLRTEQSNREFYAGEIKLSQDWIDYDMKDRGRKAERHVDRLNRAQKALPETEERIANLEESIIALEVDR